MKILKPGAQWSRDVICTGGGNGGWGCKAHLRVEQEDVFVTASHCRDETDYFNTFRCPECGHLTDLKEPVPFDPPKQEPAHSIERKKPGIK